MNVRSFDRVVRDFGRVPLMIALTFALYDRLELVCPE